MRVGEVRRAWFLISDKEVDIVDLELKALVVPAKPL
jgi:hypothetical protein